MKIKLDLILNWPNSKFFVKMTETRGFKIQKIGPDTQSENSS
jgi:hypothetical protein